ncbi:hypothetical protein [Candidatus Chloroploca sp. Khr17]|uniref:hypothetical protein n=1 Tax=Candidatus Chloroploca sp. Khr17 TaxID=2496869 RepID=UPI00101D401B|nr:hypothetical protein [Candidatus Chloroploca sp. Khr17]
MPLDLLPACIFTGPALPEPFVRLELEQALTKAGLLSKASGTEGRELQESWERYERKLRELVVRGGSERVFNHVLLPLVARLGYVEPADGGKVRTSLEDEDGGRLLVAADGSRLRVWATELEADLDAPGRRGAAARYSPLRVAQRVLLAERERMGLLTNGVELRLIISDPARTDSQVIIPIHTQWRKRRIVPDSYRLLLALASPAGLRKLPELIEQARLQQTRVTNDLRRQAREAIEGFIQAILDHPENRGQVSGVRFQGAGAQVSGVRGQVSEQGTDDELTPDTRHLNPELTPDTRHLTPETLWREGLVIVYRLLVILKLAASDDPARRFSFADSAIWRGTYAPGTALAPIVRAVLDEGAETGRMLEDGLRQLFRLFAEGVESQELTVKPLAGGLFDPAATPTLAGLRWGERAVALLLDRLLWTPRGKGGTARERVSYAALDVEDLGRVYEALLELEPGIAAEPMCRLRRQKLEVVVPIAQGVRYQVSGFRGQMSRFGVRP